MTERIPTTYEVAARNRKVARLAWKAREIGISSSMAEQALDGSIESAELWAALATGAGVHPPGSIETRRMVVERLREVEEGRR